jgi:antitoxin ParD1/3/4
MATRNVVLTEHHSELIEHLVNSGRYQNASEVLRAGLRMVEESEAQYRIRIGQLRDAVQEGFNDVDQGKVQTFAADEAAEYLIDQADQLTGMKDPK